MIDLSDVDAVAKAMLPQILAAELPGGRYVFGGTYTSPSPLAKGQMRERTDCITVNSKGQWRDAERNVYGVDVVSLLAHLRKVSPGTIRAELARTLNPNDAMNGQIVRPGLTPRSKSEDATDDRRERVMLDTVALIAQREGLTRAEALYKVALQTRKRK
jgi:hypothetical protein